MLWWPAALRPYDLPGTPSTACSGNTAAFTSPPAPVAEGVSLSDWPSVYWPGSSCWDSAVFFTNGSDLKGMADYLARAVINSRAGFAVMGAAERLTL